MPRRRNCFVIMPFSKTSSKHTEIYWTNFFQSIVHETVSDCGYHCYRSETGPSDITRQIIQSLLEDELVVAILTDYNPNVWYELAARHSFHKNTIMLIDRKQKIPFDVSSFGVIQYDDTPRGHKQLMIDLKYFIDKRLIDNTPWADNAEIDIKKMSRADNPIARALLEERAINNIPQAYKIIPHGFHNIAFPHDLVLTEEPCKILVIGIRDRYIPPAMLELIQHTDHPFQILINRDKRVAAMRATALNKRNINNYWKNNETYLEEFLEQYSTKNTEIRQYTRYPFGIYMSAGNYSWFCPLWNVDNKGSAIHQLAIEIRRKSHVGWKLFDEFNELWSRSTPLERKKLS